MPFNMPTFGGFQGATPPIMPQPQQQQVIDPRAQYEQQSLLADQLAQMASGYSGGGWGEALGDIIAAYRSKKQGQKAEGSLSAALEQERQRAEAETRAKLEAEQRRREEAIEDAARLRVQNNRIDQQFAPPEPDPQQTRDAEFADWQRRQEWLLQNQPSESSLPPMVRVGIDRLGQLREKGEITDEEYNRGVNNLSNVDLSNPAEEKEMSEGERKAAVAKQKAESAISNLRSLLVEHGTEFAGKDANVLQTAYNDALLKVKEAEELGVLSGPDVGIVEGVLGKDPTNLGSQFNPWGAENRIARLDQYAKSNNLNIMGNQGGEPQTNDGGAASAQDPRQIMATLRQANPGKSDAELEEYARNQGYIQ